MAGDLYYFTFLVPEVERARTFWSGLFGWQYEDSGPEASHIPNTTPYGGLAGGAPEAGIRLYFSVDDVDAAVAKIRPSAARPPTRRKLPQAGSPIAKTIRASRSASAGSVPSINDRLGRHGSLDRDGPARDHREALLGHAGLVREGEDLRSHPRRRCLGRREGRLRRASRTRAGRSEGVCRHPSLRGVSDGHRPARQGHQGDLEERLVEAWRFSAPAKLLREFDTENLTDSKGP